MTRIRAAAAVRERSAKNPPGCAGPHNRRSLHPRPDPFPPPPTTTASTPPTAFATTLMAEAVADSTCAPRRPPSPALEASVLRAITAGLFDSDDDDDAVETMETQSKKPVAAAAASPVPRRRRAVAATRSDSSSLSDASAATPCAAALRSAIAPASPATTCCELTSAPPRAVAVRAASTPAPPRAAPAPKRLKALRGDFWAADAAAAAACVDDPDALLAPPCDAPPTPRSLPSVSLAGLLPDQVAAALAAPTRDGGRGPLGLVLDTTALVAELNRGRF